MGSANRFALAAACAAIAVAIGACVPEHDYSGNYDMTYSLVLDYANAGGRETVGGNALVSIRPGLDSEWLIDLGPAMCALVADTGREARVAPPYLAVSDQPCWAEVDDRVADMRVTGTGTVFDEYREVDFAISLRGNFTDDRGRGVVTLDFREVW